MPWKEADTGWQDLGSSGLPKFDTNFVGGTLTVKGETYAKGIGVYPTSRITYQLDGQYAMFYARVGVDDAAGDSEGATRFLVFGDDVQLFDSGQMRASDVAQTVQVSVEGVTELRLTALDESGSGRPGLANWCEPALMKRVGLAQAIMIPKGSGTANTAVLGASGRHKMVLAASLPAESRKEFQPARQSGPDSASSAKDRLSGGGSLSTARQAGGVAVQQSPRPVSASIDTSGGRYLLENPGFVAQLAYTGEDLGSLTIVDRGAGTVLLQHAVPRITFSDGSSYVLAPDARVDNSPTDSVQQFDDPVLGHGVRVNPRFLIPQLGIHVVLQVSMFQGQSYLLYQVIVEDAPPSVDHATFDILNLQTSQVMLGDAPQYLTDFGRPRLLQVRRDGTEYQQTVGEGKPVLLWGGNPNRNLVIATLDDTGRPAQFSIKLPTDSTAAALSFSVENLPGGSGLRSPRVFLEFSTEPTPDRALSTFRQVFSANYPMLKQPPWFRYEWNSWYSFGMDVTEQDMRRQMDFAHKWLGDLGTWQMEIDAGWYVAEGRDNADWNTVDTQKFPAGLRSLTDYAHSLAERVTLYFSAPYVDSRAHPGDWLGLKKLVEQHKEFLVKVDEDYEGSGYVFDARAPSFQRYLKDLLGVFFLSHGVDGMAVDALGSVPLGLDAQVRSRAGVATVATAQTMELYRLIHSTARLLRPDAFIFSGWHLPLFANPHSDAFWFSDEVPAFTNPYPFGGLQEHVDYAIEQEALWGQRSHMGYIFGDPNAQQVPLWWLEAALALGSQAALGFDLNVMTSDTLSKFRERLAQYRPHGATPFVVGQYPPVAFGSHRDDTTYVGVMNRLTQQQEVTLGFDSLGLNPNDAYTVYDVELERYFAATGAMSVPMPAQSFRLLLIRQRPGVMWTSSSFSQEVSDHGLQARVEGPAGLDGFVDILVPQPATVKFDDEAVRIVNDPGSKATYDTDAGILRLRYPMGPPHSINIEW